MEIVITERILATIVIGLLGALLATIRRYKNRDSDAGLGVVGWTIFIILMMWIH